MRATCIVDSGPAAVSNTFMCSKHTYTAKGEVVDSVDDGLEIECEVCELEKRLGNGLPPWLPAWVLYATDKELYGDSV